jgi:hypothetical protein
VLCSDKSAHESTESILRLQGPPDEDNGSNEPTIYLDSIIKVVNAQQSGHHGYDGKPLRAMQNTLSRGCYNADQDIEVSSTKVDLQHSKNSEEHCPDCFEMTWAGMRILADTMNSKNDPETRLSILHEMSEWLGLYHKKLAVCASQGDMEDGKSERDSQATGIKRTRM